MSGQVNAAAVVRTGLAAAETGLRVIGAGAHKAADLLADRIRGFREGFDEGYEGYEGDRAGGDHAAKR